MSILLRVSTRRLLEILTADVLFPKYGPDDVPEGDVVEMSEEALRELLEEAGASVVPVGLVESNLPADANHTGRDLR